MKIQITLMAGNRVQIAVRNGMAETISITTSVAKLASPDGQHLMEAVFGVPLAEVIRCEAGYMAIIYEWDQKTGATML